MSDSLRWCATCKAYGDHHTDRHPVSDDRAIEALAEAVGGAIIDAKLLPDPYWPIDHTDAWNVKVESIVAAGVEALASAGFQITDQALVAQEREAREKAEQASLDVLARSSAAVARCAELEAALGFYATSEPRGHWTPRIMADGGRRATEALASSPSGEET